VLTCNELLFRLHNARLSIRLENWRRSLRFKNECFCPPRFCVIDFNNASSNASGGWVPKCLTFSLIAFKSRFILSYLVYPNISLSGLASQTLPHKRVEFIVGSSLQPLLLGHVFFRVLLFCYLYEDRHFKIPIRPRIWVCPDLSEHRQYFQLEFAKITQNCHDKIFSGKTDTIFH